MGPISKTWLALALLGLGLIACGEKKPEPTGTTKLFPRLAENLDLLREIRITMRHAELIITREGEHWQLAPPHQASVNPQLINQYLLELYQAPRGQVMALAPEDYPDLGLTKVSETPTDSSQRPVEVTFSFEEGISDLSVILGAFDLPDSETDLRIYGGKALARRHVRFLENDLVVLTPSSLLFLAPATESWEDVLFRPISNLKSLEVTAPDGFQWKAGRNTSFGPIRFQEPLTHLPQSSQLMKLFNSFFSFGSHAGLLPQHDQSSVLSKGKPHWKIRALDHDDTEYQIALGERYEPKSQKAPGQDLGDSMLMLSQSKPGTFYVSQLTINTPSSANDSLSQNADNFRGRLLLFPDLEFISIFEITKTLRQQTHPQQSP